MQSHFFCLIITISFFLNYFLWYNLYFLLPIILQGTIFFSLKLFLRVHSHSFLQNSPQGRVSDCKLFPRVQFHFYRLFLRDFFVCLFVILEDSFSFSSKYNLMKKKYIQIHLFVHFISQYKLTYNLRGGSQELHLLVSTKILIQ